MYAATNSITSSAMSPDIFSDTFPDTFPDTLPDAYSATRFLGSPVEEDTALLKWALEAMGDDGHELPACKDGNDDNVVKDVTLSELLSDDYFTKTDNVELTHDFSESTNAFFADYQIVRVIQQSKTSCVYEVSRNGVSYAAKTVARINGDVIPHEVKIMIHLSGVNGISKFKSTYNLVVPTIVIVMEMPAGDYMPYGCVVNEKTDEQKRCIFARLVKILREIDDLNVAHNDLHEHNFIVHGSDDQVMLIDFGRAQHKNVPFAHVATYMNWDRSPPELRLHGLFDYDRLTMWTVGLLVRNSFEKYQIPPLAEDLLKYAFVSYEQRPTISQFFDHPYFA